MTKTPIFPSQHRSSSRLILFILLLSLPILLYYGYCWGWWGRQSLLLQYLFQCSCPVASEEARFPDEVDVIIPACRSNYVELSPSGRFLQVNEEKMGFTSTHLLDLETMQKVPIPSFSSFLTDDLGFVESGLEDHIVNLKIGTQYPIQTFRYWQENAYVDGEPNLELLAITLQQAEKVFLTENYDTVVVLMPDFFINPEQSFTFDLSYFLRGNFKDVEQFLQENDIVYQNVLTSFPNKVLSPDGRFLARADGIYFLETYQKIAEGYSVGRSYRPYSGKYLAVRGWIYDGHGVIYSPFPVGPCLIETSFFIFDDTGCFVEVPQPVVKLKVPEEYLLPAQRP